MNEKSGGFGRYFKYAVGEIVLVVIGILIALYIKGWYQEKEEIDNLREIGYQIVDDLRRDTSDVRQLLEAYEPLRKDYLGIIHRSYNMDSLKNCNNCGYLISHLTPFLPTENGYILIREWKSSYESSQDSLIHDTKLFYHQSILTLELMVDMLKEDVRGNLIDWREKHEWYAYWANGVQTDSFYEYIANDPIYRNKVANFYLLLYQNYLLALRQYKAAATNLADRWESELEAN